MVRALTFTAKTTGSKIILTDEHLQGMLKGL